MGTTVVPHNLLFAFILVSNSESIWNKNDVRKAIALYDLSSNLQLSLAFVVNSHLLILRAALFFGHASEISAFSQMYNALQVLLLQEL